MSWTKKTFSHNAAPCVVCHEMVAKGAEGWTDASQPRGQRVRCLNCGPGDGAVTEDQTSPRADPVAGTSALRQDKRYRGDANLKGALGEYLMGGYLAEELAPGARVLTDRRVPGESEANIDHVVIAASGVWIVDSKKWSGEIRYRSPSFPSTDPKRYLTVGGVDRTSSIAKIYRLVIPVATIIDDRSVHVRPAMAFIEPAWGVREGMHFRRGKGPYNHEGVLLAGGHGIIAAINEPGPLHGDRVDELWHQLDAEMPPR